MSAHRVLPWRRSRDVVDVEIAPLVEGFSGPKRSEQTAFVAKAFEMASHAHSTQRRKSGEPYIVHPIAVAKIVAELGLDEVSIAAALLHDAVEDSDLTTAEVSDEMSAEVAAIVDGVTKLDRLRFDSKEAQQAASFRKMLVAMSQDLRVLIIKLCDRLHNLRTIAALPEWKQARTAQETLDIYAPLAHRFGMLGVKTQLEDLSFAALHPKRYATIENMVAVRAPERDIFLTQILEDIRVRLLELNIEAVVDGREKHLYSIYEKMVLQGKEFDEIHDLVGVRVICDSVRDCYAALGSIHATWKPVQGRFKDYVAMPKFNLYQSLHTTVIGPMGKPIEVQIRTREMHHRAEFGVAAHFLYKDKSSDDGDKAWLTRITDWDAETSDPSLFMANLKVDLDDEEVFVFTPKGDVVTLPAESTPVDFAYSVHTDVGHRTVGAKVNGRLVALGEKLTHGDTVEIFTSRIEGAGPSQDWLNFVRSPRAASKIKQWFSRERRADAIAAGAEEIGKELRRAGLPTQQQTTANALKDVAEELSYSDLASLHAAVGEHQVSPKSIATRVARHLAGSEEQAEEVMPTTVRRRRRAPGASRVHVEGLDDVMVRLARCCTPVPGDEILGFVTRGRGVSVHRSDCSNAASLASSQNDRLIEVDWDDETGVEHFLASIEVRAYDRARLLTNVSSVFSEYHVNIVSSSTITDDEATATMGFEFEIADPSHLQSLMRALGKVDGVFDTYRVLPGVNRRQTNKPEEQR